MNRTSRALIRKIGGDIAELKMDICDIPTGRMVHDPGSPGIVYTGTRNKGKEFIGVQRMPWYALLGRARMANKVAKETRAHYSSGGVPVELHGNRLVS